LKLQTVDKRTRDVEEDITDIRDDISAKKRRFQSQLEEVEAVVERGSRPAVSANTARPPTFNGNTSWSSFRRHFEIVADYNPWSDREESTYLTTASKGRAARRATRHPDQYDILRALEDRFGDQHFAAAYRCQLTTGIQKVGESLQDYATVI
jgi:hypothetical protein